MIRWRMATSGTPILGIGLEAENIKRLMEGKPIRARMAPFGTDVEIVIHYGPTKEAMIEDLRKAGITLPPEGEWKQ